MKKIKMLIVLMLTLAMVVLNLAGCGEKKDSVETDSKVTPTETATVDPTAEPTEEATATPTEEPARDLGGIEVTIGNWWAGEPAEPTTTYEEELAAYREEIQKTYNFTIKEVNIGGWGEIQELFSTSVMANDPAASIFVLDSSFVPALLNQGLFYPVNEIPSFDFTEEKWNKSVSDTMTFAGKQYGFAVGAEPRTGVFFNKRLFEDAGLSPDLPYDLQKSGEWTWAKFEELCQKLTRDVDNDGVVDTYALASFSKDYFTAAVYSNNAKFVGKDDNGMFYNATNEPNFLEALQWARSMYDKGYTMPQPEGSEWNWFTAAFHDGQVAMRVAEEYNKGSLSDMEDDWGFVMFPAGPHGEMISILRENILVIPSCYDAETADKIAFAYNLYTEPLEGYEDADNWKLSYYSAYRDERAVDETLDRMKNGPSVLRTDAYVYGLETGDIVYDLDAGAATPAEKIEAVQQTWDALIADANAVFKQ